MQNIFLYNFSAKTYRERDYSSIFMYSGNTFSSKTYDKYLRHNVGRLLQKVNFDVMALGPSDFKLPAKLLSKYIKQMPGTTVLCANLDISLIPELHGIPNFRKWETFRFETNNLTVAVIGFIFPIVQYESNLGDLKILPLGESIKCVKFLDFFKISNNFICSAEIKVIRRAIDTELVIIALGDTMHNNDALRFECPEIDIIVKGTVYELMTNKRRIRSDDIDKIGFNYPKIYKKGSRTQYMISSHGPKYIGLANIAVSTTYLLYTYVIYI